MTITVKVLGPLIKIVGGATFTLDVTPGTTVRELMQQVFHTYGDAMKEQVMNEGGTDLAPYYKILINGRNSKLMHYLDTELEEGQVVHIMPPVAGG
ncbi:MAG: MoaD family protein [Bacillota bacterium]|nr:MoaD family protein [Bacillota bacterium]MDW7678391.1 MoaD family protein [Bacillota bacterium]